MNKLFLAGILCLLVGLSQAQTEYVYNFNTIRRLTTYDLGFINNGTTLMFNFTTQGTSGTPALDFRYLRAESGQNFVETQRNGNGLDVLPGSGNDVVCIEVSGCTAGDTTCVRSCDIIRSDFYRLNLDTNDQALATSEPIPTADTTAQGVTSDLRMYTVDGSSYPTSSGGPSSSSAVVTELFRNVEVFRNKVVKLIYVDGFTNVSFTVSNVPAVSTLQPNLDPTTGGANLALYKVNNILDSEHLYDIDVTDDNLLDVTTASTDAANPNHPSLVGTDTPYTLRYHVVNYSSQNNTLYYNGTYDTQNTLGAGGRTGFLPEGFYILVLTYGVNPPASFAAAQPFVRLTYDSYSYSCPYNSPYNDFYLAFQPCLTFVNANGTNAAQTGQPGFPCLVFQNNSMTCAQCFDGFTLSNGRCLYNDTCPDREYFQFGECLPVDPACGTFDIFTGYCLTCALNDSTIDAFGKCIEAPIVCGTRQVVVNRTCVDVSVLCATFDNITGACITCVAGFQLDSNNTGNCVPIVITCADNQYLDNGVCVNFPANCVSFDPLTRRCAICRRGFWPSSLGVCQQIICPERQVPSTYGIFCIDVSPLCNDYDRLTGDCLSCRDASASVINGECKQAVSPLAGCAERQRLGFGECVNPQLNCQRYNLQTRNCEQCMTGFYLDYTGRCLLTGSTVCQADEIVIQGICHQRPNNCLVIDSIGLCQTCQPNYRNIYGQCIFTVTCAANQYQTSSGVCVDVSANCATFNPSTGQCITCVDGRNADQGVCCGTGTYAFNGNCIDDNTFRGIRQTADNSNSPSCIAYHPTLRYCIECSGQPGQFIVNPFNNRECIAA